MMEVSTHYNVTIKIPGADSVTKVLVHHQIRWEDTDYYDLADEIINAAVRSTFSVRQPHPVLINGEEYDINCRFNGGNQYCYPTKRETPEAAATRAKLRQEKEDARMKEYLDRISERISGHDTLE